MHTLRDSYGVSQARNILGRDSRVARALKRSADGAASSPASTEQINSSNLRDQTGPCSANNTLKDSTRVRRVGVCNYLNFREDLCKFYKSYVNDISSSS